MLIPWATTEMKGNNLNIINKNKNRNREEGGGNVGRLGFS